MISSTLKRLLSFLLYPFAILYDAVTRLRNYFYDKGIFEATRAGVTTISVGNLTIGGTGKTPHIEYLIRKLVDNYRLTTLSRGYGRKTKGFLVASNNTSSSGIGDEPMQFYQKFGKEVNVVVCEKRVEGTQYIKKRFPDTQLILLDDAFQHRAIHPHFSILLSDYNRPFYKDFPLPVGRIRESRRGAKRADVVLVTKCPADLDSEEQTHIKKQIQKYTSKRVFFTYFDYASPVAMNSNSLLKGLDTTTKIGVITAIANPKLFIDYIAFKFGAIHTHKNFPDHHHYTPKDVEDLPREGFIWFTTEKDSVKLQSIIKEDFPVFYIPIEVKFLDKVEEEQFWKILSSKVGI